MPERVRAAGRKSATHHQANPAAGHHWGGLQGPLDGSIDGYGNPVLADIDGEGRGRTKIQVVDWDGNGSWELLAGADFGRVWYWEAGEFRQPSGGSRSTARLGILRFWCDAMDGRNL